MVVDRVLSRLSHINPAVVLGSVKVLLKYAQILNQPRITAGVVAKISAPLTTLLSASSECVWVLLRNIQVLIEQHPKLVKSVSVFFVKYNDPSYVKIEKLRLIKRLCDKENYKSVINELVEYSFDPGAEFSRAAIQTLWKLALALPVAGSACLTAIHQILVDSARNGAAIHLVNELAVGLGLIYRKLGETPELAKSFKLLKDVSNNINEDEALVSYLDMLPCFAGKVDDNKEIVNNYVEGFCGYGLDVQFSVLTAVVKLHLLAPEGYTEEVGQLLQTASDHVSNPDLRDRAFFYWRLLDMSTTVAKKIIFTKRKPIKGSFDDGKVQGCFGEIGSIGATLQKEEETDGEEVVKEDKPLIQEKEVQIIDLKEPEANNEDLIDLDFGSTVVTKEEPKKEEKKEQNDLFDVFDDIEQKQTVQNNKENKGDVDLFDIGIDVPSHTTEVKEDPVSKPVDNNLTQSKYDDLDNVFAMSNQNNTKNNDPLVTDNNTLIPNPDKPTLITQPSPFNFEPAPTKSTLPENAFHVNPKTTLLAPTTIGKKGKSGLSVEGRLLASDEGLDFHFVVNNRTDSEIDFVKFKLGPNLYGFDIENNISRDIIKFGESTTLICSVYPDENTTTEWKKTNNNCFNMELITNIDEFEFSVPSFLNSLMVG